MVLAAESSVRSTLIIITGANGRLGRAIVERLIDRVPVEEIGVSVRDPQQAAALAERGVRVRRGDFADPASLAHAFRGASQVLVVSPDTVGELTVRLNRAAIGAAVAAGADRVLYTSHMGSNPSSPFPPMPDHAATESALAEAGVAFTALRNGFYAASAVMLLGAAPRPASWPCRRTGRSPGPRTPTSPRRRSSP
jgi:NAD(P)H dehydrogenase (quinone)